MTECYRFCLTRDIASQKRFNYEIHKGNISCTTGSVIYSSDGTKAVTQADGGAGRGAICKGRLTAKCRKQLRARI